MRDPRPFPPAQHECSTLEVTLYFVEGALVRLLGLIERRGFRIHDVEAQASKDGATLCVRVMLAGTSNVAVLCRQIERLHDVAGSVLLRGQV